MNRATVVEATSSTARSTRDSMNAKPKKPMITPTGRITGRNTRCRKSSLMRSSGGGRSWSGAGDRFEAWLDVAPVQAVRSAAFAVCAPAEEHNGNDAPDEEPTGDLHEQAGDLLVGQGRDAEHHRRVLVRAVQQALAE